MEGYVTIGQIVELLSQEFPGLSTSSLRFLEKQGLLHPRRSAGGHRLYSKEDIARIRLIKRLQTKRYYPLEVIKRICARPIIAAEIETELEIKEAIYRPVHYDPAFVPIDREELAGRTGLSLSRIKRLEEMALIFPYTNDNGKKYYDEDDLKIAELVADEVRRGAKVEDFASYARSMQEVVEEELRLFQKLLHGEEPTTEEMKRLREEAEIIHALLRAKITRHLLGRQERGALYTAGE